MKENIIKRLIASIKCDTCGQHYTEDHVDVIQHSEELWFLKVFCSACRVKALVAAIIKEDERAEIINDLSDVERDRFKDADVVSVDDVLDMHIFLKDFDSDFPRLFQKR